MSEALHLCGVSVRILGGVECYVNFFIDLSSHVAHVMFWYPDAQEAKEIYSLLKDCSTEASIINDTVKLQVSNS